MFFGNFFIFTERCIHAVNDMIQDKCILGVYKILSPGRGRARC